MRTVLVVEDEWAIADWLEVLLSEHGYHVLVANNGRQALDVLAREVPDLVLTDYMMPYIDGGMLIEQIRQNPKLRGIVIVMMTSLAEDVVRERIDGYKAFLRKPFRESDLIKTLERLIPPRSGNGS